VFLHLPNLGREECREEEELWATYHALRPKILGGLLNAVVGGLRELPSTRIKELPRMADFARFGEAVGRGLGWGQDTFLAGYLENRKQATIATLEQSILATMLLKNFELNRGFIDWTVSASDMLQTYTDRLERRVANSPKWPKTPEALGAELRRLAPLLAEYGLFVIFKRSKQARTITLTSRPERHREEATPEGNNLAS
jgi:hypothetical protein